MARESIRAIVDSSPNIEIVGEAGDGFEALEQPNKHQPHVVLIDIRIPKLDGLEATRRIKARRFRQNPGSGEDSTLWFFRTLTRQSKIVNPYCRL